MAVPPKKNDRKRGRTSASSSGKSAPAGRTSQHPTPQPAVKDKARNSDHSTNGTTSIQSPPAIYRDGTNGSRTRDLAPNALTEAHLVALSGDYVGPAIAEFDDAQSSSTLSSALTFMDDDLDSYLEKALDRSHPEALSVTAPSQITLINGAPSPSLVTGEPVEEILPLSPQEFPINGTTPTPQVNGDASSSSILPKSNRPSTMPLPSPPINTIAPINGLNGVASRESSPIPKPATSNGETSVVKSPKKRSLSSASADELALPEPSTIKIGSSRTIATPRRVSRTNTPARKMEDDSPLEVNGPDPLAAETGNTESLRRSKRAKMGRSSYVEVDIPEFDPNDEEIPYADVTPKDIGEWDGWLEMESSPEAFSVMLQEWGVRGIKTVDMWSLEPEALFEMPQPVHGLIFLYPYNDNDVSGQTAPCPDHVWFANQVAGTNACATVALMNILNNLSPNVDLGPHLRNFKMTTTALTAEERGAQLNSFKHIKAVHNSFIDAHGLIESDLIAQKDHEAALKREAADARKKVAAKLAAKKKKAAEKAATPRGKAVAQNVANGKAANSRTSPADKTGAGAQKNGVGKKKAPANSKKEPATPIKIKTPVQLKKETEAKAKAAAKKKMEALRSARYHYVAYLPIHGRLWKLDGIDDEPIDLGACEQATWLEVAAPLLQTTMETMTDGGINYSLLAVVQDPLFNETVDLATNIKTVQRIDASLATADRDWPLHPDAAHTMGDEVLDGPSDDYDVTDEMINMTAINPSNQEQLQESNGDVGSLLALKRKLLSQQKMLKSSIRAGKRDAERLRIQVDRQRRDFGPLLQWQLMDLEDNGTLDDLLDLHDEKKKQAVKGNTPAKSKGKGKGRVKSRT